MKVKIATVEMYFDNETQTTTYNIQGHEQLDLILFSDMLTTLLVEVQNHIRSDQDPKEIENAKPESS